MTKRPHLDPCFPIVLLMVLFLGLGGCSNAPKRDVNPADLENLSLDAGERDHLIEVARSVLGGGTPEKKASTFPDLYVNETRAVFITVPRERARATTQFAFGDDAVDAVTRAAEGMRERLGAAPAKAFRLDVVTHVSKPKKAKIGAKWRTDVTNSAVLFVTPAMGFLGQELKDWAVVRDKKSFSLSALKSLMRDRGFSAEDRNGFRRDAPVSFVLGKIDSSLATDKGAVETLYRGNHLNGFEPNPERLLESINAAGRYLTQAVKADGRFDYNYDPARNKSATSYNLLRHAGTTFSMMQIYEINRDPALLEAVRRALGYLDSVSMGPDPEDAKTHRWKAVTEPRILEAKLGGSGLALLAFGNYTRVTGDTRYMPLMQGYAEFIAYMQKPDGDMVQRYYHRPQDKNRTYKPVLYYPGEAFFGLMTLHHLDHNERWLNVAAKGIDYIADVRDAQKPTDGLEHDHWLLYAINEVDKLRPAANRTGHAHRVLEAMFNKFNYEAEHPDFVGGYYKRPQTTPAACRLEAKGAQYEMALRNGDKEREAKILESLKLGATFLMRNQFNDVNTMFFEDPARAAGGYPMNFWNPEIQIDFVQHSTSALINLYHALTNHEHVLKPGEHAGAPAPSEEAPVADAA